MATMYRIRCVSQSWLNVATSLAPDQKLMNKPPLTGTFAPVM